MKKIFVVDNDDRMRDTIDLLLDGMGYQVLFADSAKQAKELWAKEGTEVGLSFLDYDLGNGGKGTELCTLILNTQPDAIIIGMTGGGPSSEKKLQSYGCRQVLKKPNITEEFLSILRKEAPTLRGEKAPTHTPKKEECTKI